MRGRDRGRHLPGRPDTPHRTLGSPVRANELIRCPHARRHRPPPTPPPRAVDRAHRGYAIRAGIGSSHAVKRANRRLSSRRARRLGRGPRLRSRSARASPATLRAAAVGRDRGRTRRNAGKRARLRALRPDGVARRTRHISPDAGVRRGVDPRRPPVRARDETWGVGTDSRHRGWAPIPRRCPHPSIVAGLPGVERGHRSGGPASGGTGRGGSILRRVCSRATDAGVGVTASSPLTPSQLADAWLRTRRRRIVAARGSLPTTSPRLPPDFLDGAASRW